MVPKERCNSYNRVKKKYVDLRGCDYFGVYTENRSLHQREEKKNIESTSKVIGLIRRDGVRGVDVSNFSTGYLRGACISKIRGQYRSIETFHPNPEDFCARHKRLPSLVYDLGFHFFFFFFFLNYLIRKRASEEINYRNCNLERFYFFILFMNIFTLFLSE